MKTDLPNDQLLWLSGPLARRWLQWRGEGQTQVRTSFNLNLSQELAQLTAEGIAPTARPELLIPWDAVEEVAESEHGCYLWTEGGLERLARYSNLTNRYCSLMATRGAPTVLIAGFPMHRIKEIEPWEDTRRKIRAIGRVGGRVLDTCTGLGYTAIQAARWAERVCTVELDPAVIELAALNPWSRPLFDRQNIERVEGDVREWIERVPRDTFHLVIHDPPTVELAGDLYGAAFYCELYRVLRPGGRLYHYVGDPASAHGSRVVHGVARRLAEVGFRAVRVVAKAHGVLAKK